MGGTIPGQIVVYCKRKQYTPQRSFQIGLEIETDCRNGQNVLKASQADQGQANYYSQQVKFGSVFISAYELHWNTAMLAYLPMFFRPLPHSAADGYNGNCRPMKPKLLVQTPKDKCADPYLDDQTKGYSCLCIFKDLVVLT